MKKRVLIMYSYALSLIDFPMWEKENKTVFDPESILKQLIIFPSDLRIISPPELIEQKNIVHLTLEEPVSLSFNYFPEPTQVSLRTEVMVHMGDQVGLMVSSPRGIGIIRRGNARRYTDLIIGPLVTQLLLKKSRYYKPYRLRKKLMDWSLWGRELKGMVISVPKLGTLAMSGKELSNKFDQFLGLKSLIGSAHINKVRVRADALKRVIEIQERGVIKISIASTRDVTQYLFSILSQHLSD